MGALLSHAGVHLSEPMLFGLGSGLSFVYWDSRRQALPFIGGRVKPFVLTRTLSELLGLQLRVRETTSASRAWDQVRTVIGSGSPVGLQLDSHDLEYFRSPVRFAGHVVAMYGYDHERAYLVDTAQQGGAVSTSLSSLARARAARGPMSAPHRSFTVEAPAAPVTAERLAAAAVTAVTRCAQEFLSPPIANLGWRGIRTAARRVPSWWQRVPDPRVDLAVIAGLAERGGTGGALFRNLYRDFLSECLHVLAGHPDVGAVERGRDLFAESALSWTTVAGLVERAGATADPEPLVAAGRELEQIAAVETRAMEELLSLGGARAGT